MPFRSTPADPQSLGRRLVSAALTPRAIARVEDRTWEVTERFAARLRGRAGVIDLLAEFATPVSATALGQILGVPPKDADERRFRELAARATRAVRPILSDKQRRRMEQASVEIAEYVRHLTEERRSSPKQDLISDLLGAARREDPGHLDDVVRVVAGLVSAGTGTTAVAFARGLRALLQHPDQLALLRRERELLPNAVNELLRYDSGLLVMPRYAVERFEFRDRTIEAGQLVALSIMGANRDPRVFPDPDRLDLRRDTRESLSFGYGPHYCIGANIARLELRCMIAAALDFLPLQARLLEHEIRWSSRGMMSQLKSLPIDFGGAIARDRPALTRDLGTRRDGAPKTDRCSRPSTKERIARRQDRGG
ncbi:MAG TPA: cytochrome P450, partial [Myxococcota bacterium]|nr:cytochrome P450 [Myxococcota bacterium]